MKVGRPTDYDPRFCEVAIEAGKQGKSWTWIAAECGVSKQTAYTWMDKHPEFLDAMRLSRTLAQQWWEDLGQRGAEGADVNARIWERSMAARFPDDWREVKATEISGKDGGAIEIKTKRPEDLTDEELAALAQSGK